MTWWVLPTYTNGALTAAQLMQLRDNINETAPAKAVDGSWPQHFVVAGNNLIAPREIMDNNVDATDVTTSTEFTGALASTFGPQISMITGKFALVFSNADASNNTAGSTCRTGFDVAGATTSPSTIGRGIRTEAPAGYSTRAGATQLIALTPGFNTFTMVYRVGSGIGTFAQRRMTVMNL